MAYERKTQDIWCIDTNYGYGWETESEYTKSAYEDAKEYKKISNIQGVRVYKKRVPIEKKGDSNE